MPAALAAVLSTCPQPAMGRETVAVCASEAGSAVWEEAVQLRSSLETARGSAEMSWLALASRLRAAAGKRRYLQETAQHLWAANWTFEEAQLCHLRRAVAA
jgi:hypothetical protein